MMFFVAGAAQSSLDDSLRSPLRGVLRTLRAPSGLRRDEVVAKPRDLVTAAAQSGS